MKPKVAIRDVTAVAVREPVSRREYVLVSLATDAGVSGMGETTAWPDPQTAVRRILSYKSHLLGQDGLGAEAIRQHLLRSVRKPDAGVLAAINIALLDLQGKLTKAPIYEVLGGPTRDKVRALAHLHGDTEAKLVDSLRRTHQAGYRAFLVPLPATTGVTRGPRFFRQVLQLLEALRKAGGADTDLVLDCDGQLSPAEATSLARELEGFHLLWLEEPCKEVNSGVLRKITQESVVPLGRGRHFLSNRDFQEALRDEVIDVLRPDVGTHGLGEIRKAAALAETYYLAVAPAHRGGPILTAAALQIAAAIPNFFIQEVPTPADERDVEMRAELTATPLEKPENGFLPLPTGPGLGITPRLEVIEKYRIKS